MLNDQAPEAASERSLVLVGYGLFLLAAVNGITALIGAVIAFVRRDEARGTVWESHYRNMLRVFWAAVLLGVLFLALAFSGMLAMIGMAVGTAWLDGPGTAAASQWIFGLPLLGAAVPLLLLVGLGFGLWYLYRILRGVLRALDDRAY